MSLESFINNSFITDNFQTTIPKEIVKSININSTNFFNWEIIGEDKILINVKKLSAEELDDLKFAIETEEALREVEESEIEAMTIDEFLKELDS